MDARTNFKSGIAYDDLREWLALAERLGEVRTVRGASWQEDIGLAAEAILRAENGPCVVFDDIPGCPKGFRLLLNMFAGTRRNMTFGFPDDLTKWELSEAYREAYLKEMRIIPHEIVETGPVFENIMTGDAVDVLKFPSPVWHQLDGGRYIGTGTYSITRDPEENWLNAGAYRAQVHDKTSVGVLMAPGHHGALHREKYWKKGEALPLVMVLGGDPLAFFYGGTEAPYGVFEIDIIGGLARPAGADGQGQGHRPAVSGRCRGRARRLSSRRTGARSKARSANGPATMPAARRRIPCSTSRRSTTATIRSSRRAADGCRAGRDGALSRRAALGHGQAEHGQRRRARGATGVVPRGRRLAHAARHLDQAEICRATRCRPATSRPSAAPRPMRRNTSSWSTRMST